MSTLTKTDKGYALISQCKKYRYLLGRVVGDSKKVCLFIMLNPSTADAEKNDPTITRCMHYASAWGYGRMVVANLFAYRATQPSELKKVDDPVGPSNTMYLEAILKEVKETGGTVVCAWGNHGSLLFQSRKIRSFLKSQGIVPTGLKVNKSGEPSHPLYLSKSLIPVTLP